MSANYEQELYWIEAYWLWIWNRVQMEEEAKRETYDEKFFEKRINRINEGPPPKGKPKPLPPDPDPATTLTSQETEALHRAISIRQR